MTVELGSPVTLVLVSSVFVLMMTIPGLTLFYGSLVSRRNLVDTMLQSVMLCGTIPLMWWLIAYSLAFTDVEGPVGGFFGGTSRARLNFKPDSEYADLPESAWCVFQLTFAIITAAIAVGAVAERALLVPMVLFSNLWLLVVYCPIAHMVWGNGILMKWGVLDTAGGLVVETCSGLTALVLCYFVGARSHASDDADPTRAVLHIVGAALLWIGWLAFNGGSAYTSGMRASVTVLNTMLAGSAGGVAWLSAAFCAGLDHGMVHTGTTFHVMGGAIAGLCAATPSSGFVSPTGSVIIGACAGILCYFATERVMPCLCLRRGIDDVVSVFPVHGVAGLWGTLMTGVFADEAVGGVKGGLQGNWHVVGVQLASILVVSLWTVIGSALVIGVISATMSLRATNEDELTGLDSRAHGKSLKRFALDLADCEGPSSDIESAEESTDVGTAKDLLHAARVVAA